MFQGTYTALVTPFCSAPGGYADEVDYEALGKLIEFQVSAGVNGVVPCGSTGESATLTHKEHEQIIAFVVEKVAGRMQVIAGTGSNSTRETIRLTRFAAEAGADGALLIAPYYNRPTQAGLLAHFSKVAESVDMPLLVYNIPGRCAVNIDLDTIEELSKVPNIVGVKEASGSLSHITNTVARCGPDFTVLSGDDALTLPIMSVGGKGVIAVISNVIPERLRDMVEAFLAGDAEKARAIHYELLPLMQGMGIETNPIPVKAALALQGKMSEEIRLPLTQLAGQNLERLRALLESHPATSGSLA